MTNKVAVFIDANNVYHNIKYVKQADPEWELCYNPVVLAEILCGGNRDLVFTGFYCVRPPTYLLAGNESEIQKFFDTNDYHAAISNLANVEVKFGDLKGVGRNLREKNVDTQIVADMIFMACSSEYDTAVLVSNDGDYVSAIEKVKLLGKRVELGFFTKYLSMALKDECALSKRLRRAWFQKLNF